MRTSPGASADAPAHLQGEEAPPASHATPCVVPFLKGTAPPHRQARVMAASPGYAAVRISRAALARPLCLFHRQVRDAWSWPGTQGEVREHHFRETRLLIRRPGVGTRRQACTEISLDKPRA